MPKPSEETTAALPGSRHPGSQRLRELLDERVSQAKKSHRRLERELGWGHGNLRLVLRGRVEITLRHIEELARVLGTTPLELMVQAYMEPAPPARVGELEPSWVNILIDQMRSLELTGEVFQKLQEFIPTPTPEEVAEMRTGRRPITRFAFLIAQLQAYMCAVENVASDLKVDLEYMFAPEGAETLDNFFNALATAVERLTPPRPSEEA